MDLDLELDDETIIYLFKECVRRDLTPNELIQEIIERQLDQIELDCS